MELAVHWDLWGTSLLDVPDSYYGNIILYGGDGPGDDPADPIALVNRGFWLDGDGQYMYFSPVNLGTEWSLSVWYKSFEVDDPPGALSGFGTLVDIFQEGSPTSIYKIGNTVIDGNLEMVIIF